MTVEKDAINQAIVPSVYIMKYRLLKIQAWKLVLVRKYQTRTYKTINLKSFLTLIGIKFRLQ